MLSCLGADAVERPAAQLPAELIEILEREDTPLVDRTVRIDYDYWTAGKPVLFGFMVGNGS